LFDSLDSTKKQMIPELGRGHLFLGSSRKRCCYLIIIPKDSGGMNRENPCLAREKRASPFVQSKKRSMQGKNPAFSFFPEATI
jgi:hypothetical protein